MTAVGVSRSISASVFPEMNANQTTTPTTSAISAIRSAVPPTLYSNTRFAKMPSIGTHGTSGTVKLRSTSGYLRREKMSATLTTVSPLIRRAFANWVTPSTPSSSPSSE